MDEETHQAHARSTPVPVPSIRTVLVDVGTDMQRGVWDAPLWVPVGGIVELGPELFEVVSVRLVLPAIDQPARPVLYLHISNLST